MAFAPPSPHLHGTRTFLRSVEDADAVRILPLRTDTRIGQHLNPTPDDLGRQAAWIASQRQRPGDYYFAICQRDTGTFLGVIGIYDVQDGRAELGRYICAGAPGHAMEAAILAEGWAFHTLNLNALYCRFAPENRTTRFLTRAHGWTQVSTQPMQVWEVSRARFDEQLPTWQARIGELFDVPR